MPAGDVIPAVRDSRDEKPDISDPFRPVHGTGPLTPHEIGRIERVIHSAERMCDVQFSVFVGSAGDDPRAYAARLHGALDRPDQSVLVLVDAAERVLEVVTGVVVRRSLTDAECRLAAATMESSFIAHDLAGGLTAGIQQLATAAYEAPTLHAGELR